MAVSSKVWIDNSAPTCAAKDLNNLNNEINKAILNSGQALDYDDNTQLSKAIIVYYNATITYLIGSIVRKTGTYELYSSLTNNNVGNALPSQTTDANWEYLGSLKTTDFYISPQYDLTISGYDVLFRAVGHFYKIGTVWRLNFTIAVEIDDTSGMTIAITDVVFKNVAEYYQPILVVHNASSTAQLVTTCQRFVTVPNTNTFRAVTNSSIGNNARWSFSGDVELNAKPTGYVPAWV